MRDSLRARWEGSRPCPCRRPTHRQRTGSLPRGQRCRTLWPWRRRMKLCGSTCPRVQQHTGGRGAGGPPLPGTQHFFVVCSPDPRLQCPAPLATGLTMLLMVCWHRAQLCSNLCLHGRLRIVHDATTGHSSNHSHELTVSLGNLVLHMPTWALPLQRQRR